jgi:hypothetical protein
MNLLNANFNSNPFWSQPIENENFLLDHNGVSLFDQNGYHLTLVEQEFAKHNGYDISVRREEYVIRQDWFLWEKYDGAHINHSDLFERKGYDGAALEQLKFYADKNPLLYKIVKMKPKWGIDISIDFVDKDRVFEVFHYEWDDFIFENVNNMKKLIETFVLSKNWDEEAEKLWDIRNEWINLNFFEQTDWRTNYFGLEPEKFKNIIWEN